MRPLKGHKLRPTTGSEGIRAETELILRYLGRHSRGLSRCGWVAISCPGRDYSRARAEGSSTGDADHHGVSSSRSDSLKMESWCSVTPPSTPTSQVPQIPASQSKGRFGNTLRRASSVVTSGSTRTIVPVRASSTSNPSSMSDDSPTSYGAAGDAENRSRCSRSAIPS